MQLDLNNEQIHIIKYLIQSKIDDLLAYTKMSKKISNYNAAKLIALKQVVKNAELNK